MGSRRTGVDGSPGRARQAGFSLIEIIIAMAVLAILAGTLAPLAVRQARVAKQQETQEKLERLLVGMLGDPEHGDYGFLGDMGMLPARLEDLNQGRGFPPHRVDSDDGVGAGYDAPYVTGGPSNPFRDGWGRSFRYRASRAQVTSAGADGRFGTADDLVYPAAPPPTTANLTVVVRGLPSGGGPGETLTSADVRVRVSASVRGRRREARMRGSGPFTASGLHVGYHGLRVEGRGRYAGSSLRDVAELRRGTVALTLALPEPGGGS